MNSIIDGMTVLAIHEQFNERLAEQQKGRQSFKSLKILLNEIKEKLRISEFETLACISYILSNIIPDNENGKI